MDDMGNNWSLRCFPLGRWEAVTWTVRPDESGFHPGPASCWPDDLAYQNNTKCTWTAVQSMNRSHPNGKYWETVQDEVTFFADPIF